MIKLPCFEAANGAQLPDVFVASTVLMLGLV